MTFYLRQHDYYCGIDLHAKRMYVCILKQDGEIVFHRNLKSNPEELRKALQPFVGKDLVVGVESTFNWYWLADICQEDDVPFVLGHAFAMKAIHGGKTKNDKRDSLKIAMLQGNPHLKWAFSEAIALMIRDGQFVKEFFQQWEKRYGRGKALSILAARLGRAVFLMLKRGDAFDEAKFFHLSEEEAKHLLKGVPARKRRKTSQKTTGQPQKEVTTC